MDTNPDLISSCPAANSSPSSLLLVQSRLLFLLLLLQRICIPTCVVHTAPKLSNSLSIARVPTSAWSPRHPPSRLHARTIAPPAPAALHSIFIPLSPRGRAAPSEPPPARTQDHCLRSISLCSLTQDHDSDSFTVSASRSFRCTCQQPHPASFVPKHPTPFSPSPSPALQAHPRQPPSSLSPSPVPPAAPAPAAAQLPR